MTGKPLDPDVRDLLGAVKGALESLYLEQVGLPAPIQSARSTIKMLLRYPGDVQVSADWLAAATAEAADAGRVRCADRYALAGVKR